MRNEFQISNSRFQIPDCASDLNCEFTNAISEFQI